MGTSIATFRDQFGIESDQFVPPKPLSKRKLQKIFKKYYVERKKRGQLGEPTFANFRLFIKILAREFLLLHYNIIFFEEHFQNYRETFFDLTAKLGLINSKPAVHALEQQNKAMRTEKSQSM